MALDTDHSDTGNSDMYMCYDRDTTSMGFCSSEEHSGSYCYQHPTSTCEDVASVEEESDEDSDELLEEKQNITRALLKGLMLVEQMEGSISDFEDVLAFSKELYCKNDEHLMRLWPKNWTETKRILQDCGYKDPRELYICLDDSHITLWDVMETPDALCRHCGKKGEIKYYYLGLPEKIHRWCEDPIMCEKMMGHWKEKEHWISGVGSFFSYKEIWDGSRFNELKWFWDPTCEWMLPVRCNFCAAVISTDEIQSSSHNEEDGSYSVQCEECGTRVRHQPQYARGEPRNIALIGHWDGWQPFGYPGSHSCGKL